MAGLRLEQANCSYDVEQAAQEAWPFERDGCAGPGLLVEAPVQHRGKYLLATGAGRRIGHHFACDLSLAGVNLMSVHSVFEGNALRPAGDLSVKPRLLAPGERVRLGDVTLVYCEDVAKARSPPLR